MKYFLPLIFLIGSLSTQAQDYWTYEINFEDSDQFFRIHIDTISNPNNLWQIGIPQKTIISSAYSVPNAIVTDTIDSYPTNDTSIFVVEHVATGGGGFQNGHTVVLAGRYIVDSDSLNDYGIIEFSPDNGVEWINLLTDTLYENEYYQWMSEKPVLTGNSGGWKEFYVILAGLGPLFDITANDTVQYRFTFISDSIETNRDGLAFDNLLFEDWAESLLEFDNQFESNTFPNPTADKVKIEFDNSSYEKIDFILYDLKTSSILNRASTNESFIKVDVSDLSTGTYFYVLFNSNTKDISSGKIVKQ